MGLFHYFILAILSFIISLYCSLNESLKKLLSISLSQFGNALIIDAADIQPADPPPTTTILFKVIKKKVPPEY